MYEVFEQLLQKMMLLLTKSLKRLELLKLHQVIGNQGEAHLQQKHCKK